MTGNMPHRLTGVMFFHVSGFDVTEVGTEEAKREAHF
jgi:hypothetical protein